MRFTPLYERKNFSEQIDTVSKKNITEKTLKDKEYRRCKFVRYMRESTFDFPAEFTRSQYFFLHLTLMVTGFFAAINSCGI